MKDIKTHKKHPPESTDDIERVVECSFLRIVLEREDCGIYEHPPGHYAQADESITSRALVQVQYLPRIKVLRISKEKELYW